MCGILAWVGPGIDHERLCRATDRMTHRGPDAHGCWSDGLAWLGHRRLKIIDLSEAGAQPMANEDGTVVVVFNGEVYNFPELRAELEAKGHVFRSHSDTEVIVHAYEQYGDGCVDRLWGMFAFAVWDQRRRRLLAARDRFGKKPMNYVHCGGCFALASEIPALLETGLPGRRIDPAGLGLYWQLEYIPAPHSAFADIRKLPAGHALALEGDRSRVWRYYPPREVPAFRGSYEEAKKQLGALLEDATRRRLVSDVPVGVALSGGIDSAGVVAAARRVTAGRLVTVTVRPHLPDRDDDEGDFARATAERFGTEHHEIQPVPDFRHSLEQILRNLGEPFAVASAIPAYYLFEALRKMVTVVISGDGGDEVFAGYTHYRYLRRRQCLRRLVPDALTGTAHALLDRVYGWWPISRPRLKVAMAGLQFLRGRTVYSAPWEEGRVLRPAVLSRWSDAGPVAALEEHLRTLFAETDPMRLQMLTEQFDRMTNHILTKVDITSMAHAAEVRSPLLDHRIAHFARGLPNAFLVRGRKGKRILRDLFAEELPARVLAKPKSGFGLPLRELFATELRGYLREVLTAPHPVYDQLVDRSRMTGLIERHGAGRPFQTALLLKLLALRLWIEQVRPDLGI